MSYFYIPLLYIILIPVILILIYKILNFKEKNKIILEKRENISNKKHILVFCILLILTFLFFLFDEDKAIFSFFTLLSYVLLLPLLRINSYSGYRTLLYFIIWILTSSIIFVSIIFSIIFLFVNSGESLGFGMLIGIYYIIFFLPFYFSGLLGIYYSYIKNYNVVVSEEKQRKNNIIRKFLPLLGLLFIPVTITLLVFII